MMKFTATGNIRHIMAALMAVMVCSCAKEDMEKTINTQEENISKYISGTLGSYEVVRRGGSNRVIVSPGNGADTLAFGDSVFFYYAGYIFESGPSTIFATNVQSEAENQNFVVTEQEDTYTVFSALYDEGSFIPGLTYGLNGVRQGESCIILFSARYGFYDKAVGNIPEMSALCYKIWVDRIKKNI